MKLLFMFCYFLGVKLYKCNVLQNPSSSQHFHRPHYSFRCNAAVNVFPDPPYRGAAWGLPRGLPVGLLFVQAPGVWGFLQVLSPDWNHGICLY